MKTGNTVVGIIMGSDSDLPIMQAAANILKAFVLDTKSKFYRLIVLQTHAQNMRPVRISGIKLIIAGARRCSFSRVTAAHFPLPVIGVPIPSKTLDGLDSLLSIVQMPGGVPVATVAIGGGKNAGLLAVQILAANDIGLLKKMIAYKKNLEKESLKKNKKLETVKR
jgi:5-(carboxyamino)imidazole ribonucleotide mutase